MSANSTLIPAGVQAGWQGFSNLFARENQRWWKTKFWLVQFAIWLVIINGAIALIYNIPVEKMYKADQANVSATDLQVMQQMREHPELIGLTAFVRLAGIATAIGAVMIAQDAVIGERQSGTAAWILSKPVSRSAFILAKLAGNALGILGVMDILLGAAVYLQIWLVSGLALPVLPFAGMLGLLFLNQLFYLTLTVMLGALSNSRGFAVGLPLLLIIGYQFLMRIIPAAGDIMPWHLVTTLERPALALSLAQGQGLTAIAPPIATTIWCLVFSLAAVLRFQKEEF